MSELSYSQYGEDKIFARYLGDEPRRLLDVGAWNPKVFSNSRLLIERGWRAVLVEFSPGPVQGLVREYAGNDRVQILQAAVTIDGNGDLSCFRVTDDGLSTQSPEVMAKWAEKGGYYGDLWVPRLSLQHLLFQFGSDFDFVSFDAEGTSVDLAKNYLVALGQKPKVVCVEHDDRVVELMAAAQEVGYQMVHANGTNAILLRS